MSKTRILTARILYMNLCLLLIFAGCGKDIIEGMNEEPPETASSSEREGEEIEGQKDGQDFSSFGMDEKIYMYLCEYGSMPVFSEVEKINEEWLISKFYHYRFSEYEDYYLDSFYQFYATVEDIEIVSQKYINPQIQIDPNIEVKSYSDGGLIWNSEIRGFMFSATGGMSREYDYLFIDTDEKNGLLYVSCVEVMIVWDDEYMHKNGIVYIGSKEVGTVEGDID